MHQSVACIDSRSRFNVVALVPDRFEESDKTLKNFPLGGQHYMAQCFLHMASTSLLWSQLHFRFWDLWELRLQGLSGKMLENQKTSLGERRISKMLTCFRYCIILVCFGEVFTLLTRFPDWGLSFFSVNVFLIIRLYRIHQKTKGFEADESPVAPCGIRHCRYRQNHYGLVSWSIVADKHDPGVLTRFSDVHCKYSIDGIIAALTDNHEAEQLFDLIQPPLLVDCDAEKTYSCDTLIESMLKHYCRTSISNGNHCQNGKAKSTAIMKRNFMSVRFFMSFLPWSCPDSRHWFFVGIEACCECVTDTFCWPTSKHFSSMLCLASGNSILGEIALFKYLKVVEMCHSDTW